MNDLYISLKYMTPAELKRTSREFSADAEDRSTPGWFVEAYRNEGYDRVVKLTRVTDEAALRIAYTVDTFLPVGTPRLEPAVRIANGEHTRELQRLRERAEQQLHEAARTLKQINDTLGDR